MQSSRVVMLFQSRNKRLLNLIILLKKQQIIRPSELRIFAQCPKLLNNVSVHQWCRDNLGTLLSMHVMVWDAALNSR